MSIDAMKQALEALRTLHDENMDYLTRNKLGGENNQCMVFARETITALRRAIENAEQQEPYKFAMEVECTNCGTKQSGILTFSPPPHQPLSDEQIKQIELSLRQYNSRDTYDLSLNDFARAIEAACTKGEA